MKLLTYKFVKDKFKERGYNLLSKMYINNRTKLNYICSGGHEHNITWNDFKSGKGCRLCGPENLITLCVSCNSRANFHRKWHKDWYQIIIKNRVIRRSCYE